MIDLARRSTHDSIVNMSAPRGIIFYLGDSELINIRNKYYLFIETIEGNNLSKLCFFVVIAILVTSVSIVTDPIVVEKESIFTPSAYTIHAPILIDINSVSFSTLYP